MPYVLYRDLTAGNGALIDQVSHWDVNLFSGAKLPPGFDAPLRFEIDVDSEGRQMPTLFMVPAFVAHRGFHQALLSAGVDNVDAYPAVILNPDTGEELEDYLYLNVIGRVECVDMAASEYHEIGPDINLIDQVVMSEDKVPQAHMWRLQEDPVKVVVSDRLHREIHPLFDDIHFQPVIVR